MSGMDTASLRDLGIVPLKQALDDGALGVAEQVRMGGLKPNKYKKMYWCTLCCKYMTKATAYSHRSKHEKELHEDNRPTALEHLQRTLDDMYGMCAP